MGKGQRGARPPFCCFELPARLMQYKWKCSQEAPALQEKHAEVRRTEVLSGAYTIVQQLCHVAYVWLLTLCPNACMLPLCVMLWSVLQERFFCPITDGFFHSFQKTTSLLASCCTSFATEWAMSVDGSNLLRLMFRLLTVAFLPRFRSWRGVLVRAVRSMPFSLVLPSACPRTGAVWWNVPRDSREPVLWSSAIAMGPQRAFLVMVGADELKGPWLYSGESPSFIRDIQILAWGRCSQ